MEGDVSSDPQSHSSPGPPITPPRSPSKSPKGSLALPPKSPASLDIGKPAISTAAASRRRSKEARATPINDGLVSPKSQGKKGKRRTKTIGVAGSPKAAITRDDVRALRSTLDTISNRLIEVTTQVADRDKVIAKSATQRKILSQKNRELEDKVADLEKRCAELEKEKSAACTERDHVQEAADSSQQTQQSVLEEAETGSGRDDGTETMTRPVKHRGFEIAEKAVQTDEPRMDDVAVSPLHLRRLRPFSTPPGHALGPSPMEDDAYLIDIHHRARAATFDERGDDLRTMEIVIPRNHDDGEVFPLDDSGPIVLPSPVRSPRSPKLPASPRIPPQAPENFAELLSPGRVDEVLRNSLTPARSSEPFLDLTGVQKSEDMVNFEALLEQWSSVQKQKEELLEQLVPCESSSSHETEEDDDAVEILQASVAEINNRLDDFATDVGKLNRIGEIQERVEVVTKQCRKQEEQHDEFEATCQAIVHQLETIVANWAGEKSVHKAGMRDMHHALASFGQRLEASEIWLSRGDGRTSSVEETVNMVSENIGKFMDKFNEMSRRVERLDSNVSRISIAFREREEAARQEKEKAQEVERLARVLKATEEVAETKDDVVRSLSKQFESVSNELERTKTELSEASKEKVEMEKLKSRAASVQKQRSSSAEFPEATLLIMEQKDEELRQVIEKLISTQMELERLKAKKP